MFCFVFCLGFIIIMLELRRTSEKIGDFQFQIFINEFEKKNPRCLFTSLYISLPIKERQRKYMQSSDLCEIWGEIWMQEKQAKWKVKMSLNSTQNNILSLYSFQTPHHAHTALWTSNNPHNIHQREAVFPLYKSDIEAEILSHLP